jgi:hypothetical protein
MINENIAKEMLEEFDGCDSDNPGSPSFPAVWMFGIEHGSPKNWRETGDEGSTSIASEPIDVNYSVSTQLAWPYNQKAFKLLTAMMHRPVSEYSEFARDFQPFVRGLNGENKKNLYFKGNLYPYACHNEEEWPDDAKNQTGITDKEEYRKWCLEHRFPTIKNWIDKYQPKIFIGVGNSYRNEFSLAVFGHIANFKVHRFEVNQHGKTFYFATDDRIKLVVIPHLSGSSNGLNSDESLQKTGEFIAGL